MTYLLTWGLGPYGDQVLWMLGEVVKLVKPPSQHITQDIFPCA
jgi:hypothetical protein